MKNFEASGAVSEGLVDLSILMATVEASEGVGGEEEESEEAVEEEGD